MNNITTLDPSWTEDVITENIQHVAGMSTTINPHQLNVTSLSTLDLYNSTQTNRTIDTPVDDEPSLVGLWSYLVARALSGVLAIFGNSLTILAVVRFERLQTCTNYLICSLAVSDLLAGLMVLLVLVHELYPTSHFFVPICLSEQALAMFSATGNMVNILYLSIDRYIYVAFALRYHSLVTPRIIFIILTVTWINFLISVPTIILAGNHLQVGMPCRYHIFLDQQVQITCMYPQAFFISLSTIGFHLAIARIAHKQARQIQAEQQAYSTLAVAINQSTKKISRTFGMILGFYIFSLVPIFIVGGMTTQKAFESYDRSTIALYTANTWVNPLIYAWRLKDFKIAFKKIFTGTGSFNEVPGMVV